MLGVRTRSLKSQSALLITGRLVGFVLAFAIPIALVRLLDQDAFGTYKQFFLVAGLLVSVLPMGLDASLFFLSPQDPNHAGNYFLQTFGFSIAIGVLAGVGLWVLRDPLAGLLNSPLLATIVPWLVVYLVLEIGGQLVEQVVIIEGQARLAAVVLAVSDGVKAIALLLPAALTRDLYWVAVGATGYAALRALAVLGWAWWQYRGRIAPWRLVRLREQLRYSLPFGGGAMLQNALMRYHAFFAASAFSPAQFAIYAVGSQQIPPVQIFFKSLFEVALVRMTEYFGAGRFDAMRDLWKKLIVKQAALIVPLVVALWVLAEPFIAGVFTTAFVPAVPIFRVSLLMILLTMLNDHAVLRAVGSTTVIFMANAVALGSTVVLVPILVDQLGMTGAALGLVGAIAISKVFGLWWLGRLLHIPARDVLPWRSLFNYTLASAVAAAAIMPLFGWFDPPLLRFFACGALFWIFYFAIGWVTGLFSAEDKASVLAVARAARTRLRLSGP